MTPPYYHDEFIKAIKWAISGYGGLPINNKIKKLNELLFNKYNVSRAYSMKDFMGYFYECKLNRKYDPVKCSLRTYTTSCAYYYLLKRVEVLERRKKVFVSFDTMLNAGLDPSNDLMKKGDDGVWRVESEVFQGGDSFRPQKILNPEEVYLQKELVRVIEDYLCERDEVWVAVFHGYKTLKDVAEERDQPASTIRSRWAGIKEGLVKHLKSLEYSYKDVYEVLKECV